MLKNFSFYLFIINLFLLSACSQVYSRLIDDGSSFVDQFASNFSHKQSVNENIINNPTLLVAEPSSSDIPSSHDSVNNDKDKISSNQFPAKKPDTSNGKESTPVPVLVDISKNKKSSEVISNQHKTVDAVVLTESVNVYNPPDSNQVVLRNGDVIIDFSNEMPVINSRNSFEFKSP